MSSYTAGPTEELKPLTLWEKIKAGASGFFKTAKDYIPSGLLYTGLAIGGSLAVTAISTSMGMPIDILGLMGAGGGVSLSALAIKGIGTMALGTAVSGLIGGFKGASAASDQRNAEIEWQQRGVAVSPRARGQQRQQDSGFGQGPAQQRGLPSQQQSTGRVAPGF